MAPTTRFLSRLLGVYCLIVGLIMLVHKESTVATVTALLRDPPLVYVLGVIVLFAGLAMILVHNRWSGGVVPVLVTVVGWLTLVKGVVLIGWAPAGAADVYLVQLRYVQLYYLYSVMTLALGAVLTYAGSRKT
jgi:vacuolar-type H+-ATPase subunit I/STV1